MIMLHTKVGRLAMQFSTSFSNTWQGKPAEQTYAFFQHLRLLSNKIILYISLVNTSVHPATVDVVKYTALLSTTLNLVLIVFYLYRYYQTYAAQSAFNLKQQ